MVDSRLQLVVYEEVNQVICHPDNLSVVSGSSHVRLHISTGM